MASPASLELIRVTKRYGSTVAVDAIDLKIPAGIYCCLLGPSGLRQDLHAADDRATRR